jgi:hypothetical protein
LGIFIFEDKDNAKVTKTKLTLKESNTPKENVKKGSKSKKKLRRNLRRLANRKGISYDQATIEFFKVKSLSELNRSLVYSLEKKPSRRKSIKNVSSEKQ